eukprot:scaffold7348_cov113-Isochrysis_galbana.AAC.7
MRMRACSRVNLCSREHLLHLLVVHWAEVRDYLDTSIAVHQHFRVVKGEHRAPVKAEGAGAIRPAVCDPRHHQWAAGRGRARGRRPRPAPREAPLLAGVGGRRAFIPPQMAA